MSTTALTPPVNRLPDIDAASIIGALPGPDVRSAHKQAHQITLELIDLFIDFGLTLKQRGVSTSNQTRGHLRRFFGRRILCDPALAQVRELTVFDLMGPGGLENVLRFLAAATDWRGATSALRRVVPFLHWIERHPYLRGVDLRLAYGPLVAPLTASELPRREPKPLPPDLPVEDHRLQAIFDRGGDWVMDHPIREQPCAHRTLSEAALLVGLAARGGEVRGIEIGGLGREHVTVPSIKKTPSRRPAVEPWAMDMVRQWLTDGRPRLVDSPDGVLFPAAGNPGRPRSAGAFSVSHREFNRMLVAEGLVPSSFRSHHWRAIGAMRHYARHKDLLLLLAHCGWRSPGTASRYMTPLTSPGEPEFNWLRFVEALPEAIRA